MAEEAVEKEKEATAAGEDEEKEEEEEGEARTGQPHHCCCCTLSWSPSTMMMSCVRRRRRCAWAKRSGGRSGEVVRSGAGRDASGAVAMKGGGVIEGVERRQEVRTDAHGFFSSVQIVRTDS